MRYSHHEYDRQCINYYNIVYVTMAVNIPQLSIGLVTGANLEAWELNISVCSPGSNPAPFVYNELCNTCDDMVYSTKPQSILATSSSKNIYKKYKRVYIYGKVYLPPC